MPIRPRARLKGYAVRDYPRRYLSRNDRILPDRAGKIFLGRKACRPRAGEMDIHGIPPCYADASGTFWLFLRGRVARLGLGIHWIETGQHGAAVHLVDDPGFHSFLLRAFGQNEVEKRFRNHHGPVLIGDDNVVREDRHAAAADRLPPNNAWQTRPRPWGR